MWGGTDEEMWCFFWHAGFHSFISSIRGHSGGHADTLRVASSVVNWRHLWTDVRVSAPGSRQQSPQSNCHSLFAPCRKWDRTSDVNERRRLLCFEGSTQPGPLYPCSFRTDRSQWHSWKIPSRNSHYSEHLCFCATSVFAPDDSEGFFFFFFFFAAEASLHNLNSDSKCKE